MTTTRGSANHLEYPPSASSTLKYKRENRNFLFLYQTFLFRFLEFCLKRRKRRPISKLNSTLCAWHFMNEGSIEAKQVPNHIGNQKMKKKVKITMKNAKNARDSFSQSKHAELNSESDNFFCRLFGRPTNCSQNVSSALGGGLYDLYAALTLSSKENSQARTTYAAAVLAIRPHSQRTIQRRADRALPMK